jgi:hypothetical protein
MIPALCLTELDYWVQRYSSKMQLCVCTYTCAQRGVSCMLECDSSYFHERLVRGNKLKVYQEKLKFRKNILTTLVVVRKKI